MEQPYRFHPFVVSQGKYSGDLKSLTNKHKLRNIDMFCVPITRNWDVVKYRNIFPRKCSTFIKPYNVNILPVLKGLFYWEDVTITKQWPSVLRLWNLINDVICDIERRLMRYWKATYAMLRRSVVQHVSIKECEAVMTRPVFFQILTTDTPSQARSEVSFVNSMSALCSSNCSI